MSKPTFKVGDWVICVVDDVPCNLIRDKKYLVAFVESVSGWVGVKEDTFFSGEGNRNPKRFRLTTPPFKVILKE